MVHGHGPQCGEQDHDRKGYHDFSMVHAGLRPCQHVQDERHEKRDKQGVHDDDGKRKSNVAPIYAHPYQAGGTCRHQGNDDKPRDDLRIVENQPGNEPGTQRQSDIENDEMKEKKARLRHDSPQVVQPERQPRGKGHDREKPGHGPCPRSQPSSEDEAADKRTGRQPGHGFLKKCIGNGR